MKDLKFTNQAGTIAVTYRTDLIDATANNFTVHQITGIDPQDALSTLNTRERVMIGSFKKLPYNLFQFIAFADEWGLTLTSANTDGSGLVTLIGWDASDSES